MGGGGQMSGQESRRPFPQLAPQMGLFESCRAGHPPAAKAGRARASAASARTAPVSLPARSAARPSSEEEPPSGASMAPSPAAVAGRGPSVDELARFEPQPLATAAATTSMTRRDLSVMVGLGWRHDSKKHAAGLLPATPSAPRRFTDSGVGACSDS